MLLQASRVLFSIPVTNRVFPWSRRDNPPDCRWSTGASGNRKTGCRSVPFSGFYYGYPPSYYEGINVDECRNRCGEALARRDSVEADFVCGIPDSGVGHAIGYSNERSIRIKGLIQNYTPTWPRSFIVRIRARGIWLPG
jgi:glutamine phosphoribosylpyrophosphate amidotransferase